MAFALWRRRRDAKIVALYGAIVAQARSPAFYTECGVADTVQGRFESVVLHLALVMRRLRNADGQHSAATQSLFDHFCRDMEGNLRELGVSDLRVPKRMRGFGEAFYGRASAYDRALDGGDAAELASAVSRNMLPGQDNPTVAAARLADYVLRSEHVLREQDAAEIVSGNIAFPAVVAALSQAAGEDGR
jgi:cytochrome b pre-mRNA-processing protein 3